NAKLELFHGAHGGRVFHPLRDQHAAHAALAEAVTIEDFVDRRAEAVDSLVDVDARLDGGLPQVGPWGDFNFLFFLNELDNRHDALIPISCIRREEEGGSREAAPGDTIL